MTTQRPKAKLTFQDYLNTPDDERYELLDGELIMAPSPNTLHQTINLNLSLMLQQFVRGRNLGKVLFAPYDVKLSDTDAVQPDLLFVSNARAGIITPNNIQGAPDFIVEIQSPSTSQRDWNDKRRLYALHGVTEYWLIDPETRTVAVLLLNDGEYEQAGNFGEGSIVSSATVEGFSAAVDEIFAS